MNELNALFGSVWITVMWR